MQAKFNCIGEVRALGMMVAIELVKNRARRRARCRADQGAWCRPRDGAA